MVDTTTGELVKRRLEHSTGEARIPVYVLLGLFLAGPGAVAAYFVPRINRIARAPR